jgi:hypothetical protein
VLTGTDLWTALHLVRSGHARLLAMISCLHEGVSIRALSTCFIASLFLSAPYFVSVFSPPTSFSLFLSPSLSLSLAFSLTTTGAAKRDAGGVRGGSHCALG